jgi:hypothetical protein
LAACLIVFVGYSTYILKSRVEAEGIKDPTVFVGIAEQARDFKINEPYRTMLKSETPGVSQLVMTGSSLTYYMNHGYFEFSNLYEHEQNKPPLFGVMQFAPVVQVLNTVGVKTTTVAEGQDRIPKPGLFYTFFGNVLIDYGVFGGLFYCFLLGAFIKLLWVRAKAGSLLCLLLYPFFVSVIFHFPMLDMIAGGYGLFVLFGIVFSVGLIRFFGAVYNVRQKRRAVLQTA